MPNVSGLLPAAAGPSSWIPCIRPATLRGLLLALATCSLAPLVPDFTHAAEEPKGKGLLAGRQRPNVILVVADDLGWADLACYGSRFHRTPHLDRLAAEGVRFTDAYSACPVCSPSRAAILTGKWPARLHLTDWLPGRPDRPDQKLARPDFRPQLPLAEPTLAEMLQGAGYVTGHIGKWHLGGEGFEPTRQGFATNVAGDHTGTPLSYFAPFRARNAAGVTRSMPGLEQAAEGEYLTDRLTTEAERFLDAHHDRPFFLYLAHYAVHIPLRAKQALVERYPAERVPGQQSNAIYAAMLESLDESVGRLRAKLEQLQLTERTLVIFTSDNGGLATLEGPNTPATSNAPLREGKGYLYEGGIRVPLIMSWPNGASKGALCQEPVGGWDLTPTILSACGVKAPQPVDGVSLTGLLSGDTDLARDTLYWHYPHYSNQGGRPGGAVREGNWKLVEFYETGRRELFDLAKDPREARNLASDRPDEVRRLAEKLAVWKTEVNAQTMRANPDYLPNPPGEDGIITLAARTAEVHGDQLRFEPLPHKNTLGFWVKEQDWASWELTVRQPGKYQVVVWQGCGTGQGGSQVEFAVGDQRLAMTVVDTGHFQNFQERAIGTIEFSAPGRQSLSVRAKSKAKAAVMDLRQIQLRPVLAKPAVNP